MEKIYRILLGIFLVCLIPILLVLSYWSCRYSYYGTVDYSIRNLLIKDSTWKHFVIFLLASVIVYEGDKWLTAQNQIKQEKICIYTLLATSVTAFLLGSIYVLNNPYYPVGDQISATAFAAYCRMATSLCCAPEVMWECTNSKKDWGYYTRSCLPFLETLTILRPKFCM